MSIRLAGPWLYAWGAWHVLWLLGLTWSGVAVMHGTDIRYVALYFAALYTVFLPLEIVGAVQDARSSDDIARTMSEFRQFLPVTMAKGPSGTGWRALGYTGVIDALIVGWLLWSVHPWAGAILSILLAMWLVPHFGWRHRVG